MPWLAPDSLNPRNSWPWDMLIGHLTFFNSTLTLFPQPPHTMAYRPTVGHIWQVFNSLSPSPVSEWWRWVSSRGLHGWCFTKQCPCCCQAAHPWLFLSTNFTAYNINGIMIIAMTLFWTPAILKWKARSQAQTSALPGSISLLRQATPSFELVT